MNLRTRLAASHVLVAGLPFLVAALWLPRILEQHLVGEWERRLAHQAQTARRLLEPLPSSQPLDPVARRLSRELGVQVTLFDGQGHLLSKSERRSAPGKRSVSPPEVEQALRMEAHDPQLLFARSLPRDELTVSLPLFRPAPRTLRSSSPSDQPVAVLRLSQSLAQVRRSTRDLQGRLLLALAAVMLTACGISLLITRSIALPLRSMRKAALTLSQPEPTPPVLSLNDPLRPAGDELRALAEAQDQMATRLQHSIAALSRDRSQMQTVFNTMADGLLVTDAEGRVRLLNPSAAALLGVTLQNTLGKTVLEVTLDGALQDLLNEVRRTRTATTAERTLRAAGERIVMVSAVPVTSSSESSPDIQGAVLVFRDLTAVRRAEQIRRDFVANASHELRTPLASMKVMVESLLSGAAEDPEIGPRFLQILDRELRRMTSLVNDLLDLSLLDARIEPPPAQPVFLASVAADLVAGSQAVAAQRDLRLQVEVPEDLVVYAEPEGMRQILVNLLDNALKYTPSGGQVSVYARRQGTQALIEVIDTGIGIPASALDRIFERFYRVDKDRSREVGGTGLGLSIVKHLVQSYGGVVAVESRLNRGSTFRVRLPLATSEALADDLFPSTDPGAGGGEAKSVEAADPHIVRAPHHGTSTVVPLTRKSPPA